MAEGGRSPLGRRYAVVGGGVSGLAAARVLAGLEPVSLSARPLLPGRVVLFEAAACLGGKVRTAPFGPGAVELGPDQFLRRDRSAELLVRRLGLGDDLVAPGAAGAGLYSRGRLRSLPAGLVLGIPTDLAALAASGIVPPEAVAEAALDEKEEGPPFTSAELGLDDDGAAERSAGELLRERLGDAVVERLVDPLLGGINAGSVDELSLSVVAPRVAEALLGERRVMAALRSHLAGNGAAPSGPVFLGLRGGLGRLVAAARAELAGAGVELKEGSPVTSLNKAAGGRFELAAGDDRLVVDGVVLALPGGQLGRLLATVAPAAAASLGGVPYADVAVVTFSFGKEVGDLLPPGTGLLVPRREGLLMTAATWLSRKWPWMGEEETTLVRVSAGRFGDERAGELSDGELARQLAGELSQVTGLALAPKESLVTRHEASFPQYLPGHRHKVAAATRAVRAAGEVTLAGAVLGGIGLPACISSGEAAAAQLLAGET